MKRKNLIIFFVSLFVFVIGINNVSAEVLSWDLFADRIIEDFNDEQFKTEKNNNVLNIIMTSDEFSYTIPLKYENNVISYKNIRDLSVISKDDEFNYVMIDNLVFMGIISELADYYGYADSVEFFTTLISDALVVTLGDKVTYSNKNISDNNSEQKIETSDTDLEVSVNMDADISISFDTIQQFSIDLVKVDKLVNEYKSTSTTTTTTFFIENPDTIDFSIKMYIFIGTLCVIGISILGIKYVKSYE